MFSETSMLPFSFWQTLNRAKGISLNWVSPRYLCARQVHDPRLRVPRQRPLLARKFLELYNLPQGCPPNMEASPWAVLPFTLTLRPGALSKMAS